jgi:hypothetical protein
MRKIAPVLLLVLAAAFGLTLEAHAAFVGDYDLSLWTNGSSQGQPAPGGGGSANIGGAPNVLIITGGDQPQPGCITAPCVFAFSRVGGAANHAAVISFHWEYTTDDRDNASFDPFGYFIGGTQHPLTVALPSTMSQSGDISNLSVLQTQEFGFYIACGDCLLGPAVATISSFDTSGDLAATPEPGTLLLVGTSAVGMVAAWRRRQRKQ